MANLPFKPAKTFKRKAKFLIEGMSGSGKTLLALKLAEACQEAGKTAAIDVCGEGGLVAYKEMFDFDLVETDDPDEIESIVQALGKDPEGYGNLIGDPVSPLWEITQAKFRDIFAKKKGVDPTVYTFTPISWLKIKGFYREVLRSTAILDCNVFFTAHTKVELKEQAGNLVATGKILTDGEKKTGNMFDVVLRLEHDEGTRDWWYTCMKARAEYGEVLGYERTRLIHDDLIALLHPIITGTGKAGPVVLADANMVALIRNQLNLLKATEAKVRETLESYSADSIEELTQASAEHLSGRLATAVVKLESAKG